MDIWLFEDLCARIETLQKSGGSGELIGLVEQAIELYRGQFLSLEEDYWFISPRESLHGRFIKIVKALGDYFENHGEPAKAAACYEKALTVDDILEEFYQRLMRCYEKEGRCVEAMTVYHRCRKTLDTKLNVRPSAKTQALFDALKRKGQGP